MIPVFSSLDGITCILLFIDVEIGWFIAYKVKMRRGFCSDHYCQYFVDEDEIMNMFVSDSLLDVIDEVGNGKK